eukprot:6321148-Pyramimonas_sp.AAC.1
MPGTLIMRIRESLANGKGMCAELRREPHFENEPPPIREALANVQKGICTARRREPHFENDSLQFVELLQLSHRNLRGAKARATF